MQTTLMSYDERSYAMRQQLKRAIADGDVEGLRSLLEQPICRQATMNTDASMVHWVDTAHALIRSR